MVEETEVERLRRQLDDVRTSMRMMLGQLVSAWGEVDRLTEELRLEREGIVNTANAPT